MPVATLPTLAPLYLYLFLFLHSPPARLPDRIQEITFLLPDIFQGLMVAIWGAGDSVYIRQGKGNRMPMLRLSSSFVSRARLRRGTPYDLPVFKAEKHSVLTVESSINAFFVIRKVWGLSQFLICESGRESFSKTARSQRSFCYYFLLSFWSML